MAALTPREFTDAVCILAEQLCTEVVTGGLDAETEKKLEALADAVNACLTADNGIAPGKEADLDRALAAYHEAIAAVIGPARARLATLLKAEPAVAERLRAAPQAET